MSWQVYDYRKDVRNILVTPPDQGSDPVHGARR